MQRTLSAGVFENGQKLVVRMHGLYVPNIVFARIGVDFVMFECQLDVHAPFSVYIVSTYIL